MFQNRAKVWRRSEPQAKDPETKPQTPAAAKNPAQPGQGRETTSREATAAAERPSDPVQAGQERLSAKLAAAVAVPVDRGATWEQFKALGRYMTKTEVHTYAFSVAAQVILSLFPFIVLLLTLSQRLFHSPRMADVVGEMMSNFLPNHQEYIVRNMRALAFSHAQTKIFSLVMLFITVTGVFLPLEVALNSVWGVTKNRSYLANQAVSIGLAVGVAMLAMASVALSAAQQTVLGWIFFGHTDNFVFSLIGKLFLQIVALLASIGLFSLIYWGLPNRKIPLRAVLPTAVVMGVLWTAAKYIYIFTLPHLDFRSVYGPFEISVGLMMWAFISGLLLLAGAYVSATRHGLRETREHELQVSEDDLQG